MNKSLTISPIIFSFLLFYAALSCLPALASDIGAFIPGKGWVMQKDACDGDSTPLQFIPKTGPDPAPLAGELEKYPRCVHCGMSRQMWHHSRHLVHYSDDLAVGTCSIRCLAVNLSLNLDRGVKNIWAADFSSPEKPAPMIDADSAVYLIGSQLKGTMTMHSKMAFSSAEEAQNAMKANGGQTADFNAALKAAFADMADDTVMIRERRAKKMLKMQKTKK